MLRDIKEFLFLRLTLPAARGLAYKDYSVKWRTLQSTHNFEVGKTYLPPSIIVNPETDVVIETKERIFKLPKNSAFLAKENESFKIKYQSATDTQILLLFLGKDSNKECSDYINNLSVKKTLHNENTLNNSAKTFISGFDALRYDRLYLGHLHESFLSRVFHIKHRTLKEISKLGFKKSVTREDIYKKLYQSAEYIEDMYNKNISLDELAKESGISKYHYIRSFKMLFHLTPYEYLLNVKTKRAKELLFKTDLSIKDISYNLGYENTSHFSFNFKKSTGFSPFRYRQFYKKSNII